MFTFALSRFRTFAFYNFSHLSILSIAAKESLPNRYSAL